MTLGVTVSEARIEAWVVNARLNEGLKTKYIQRSPKRIRDLN